MLKCVLVLGQKVSSWWERVSPAWKGFFFLLGALALVALWAWAGWALAVLPWKMVYLQVMPGVFLTQKILVWAWWVYYPLCCIWWGLLLGLIAAFNAG